MQKLSTRVFQCPSKDLLLLTDSNCQSDSIGQRVKASGWIILHGVNWTTCASQKHMKIIERAEAETSFSQEVCCTDSRLQISLVERTTFFSIPTSYTEDK